MSLKIGSIMLTDRSKKHWTWEIAKRVRTTPGTANRVFVSFKRRGWVECTHEQVNADAKNRQPRVLYSLTLEGIVAMRDALLPFQHAPIST